MIRNNQFITSRALSFNIGYIITAGITAVLLVGLTVATGGMVESQQDRVISEQVQIVGDQTSNAVMMVDRGGEIGANTSVKQSYVLESGAVLGPYNVYLLSNSGNPVVHVETVNEKHSYTVPVQIDASVKDTAIRGGQTMNVIYDTDPNTGESTIRLDAETTVEFDPQELP